MNKCRPLTILSLLIIYICSSVCMAGEGFFDILKNPPPPSIQSKLGAVFFIFADQSRRQEVGTSFVISREQRGNDVRVLFVTSAHVVGDACAPGVQCRNIRIFAHTDTFKWATVFHGLDFDFNPISLQVIKTSPELDLTLIEGIFRSDFAPREALEMSKDCSYSPGVPNYSIGFPDTTARNSLRETLEGWEWVAKRWTRGEFVKHLRYLPTGQIVADEAGHFAGYTNDGLSGASGSPFLNQFGEVIGVVKASASTSSNDYSYAGKEDVGIVDWNIVVVRCEKLKEFLSTK